MDCVECAELKYICAKTTMAYLRINNYFRTLRYSEGSLQHQVALETLEEAKREHQSASLAFKKHRTTEHERGTIQHMTN